MAHVGPGAAGRLIRALLLSGGQAFAGNACIGQSCTLIGCSNAALIDIGHEGAWPDGSYKLELSVDDAQRTCEFVAPDDLPSDGSLLSLDCRDGVDALLRQRTKCTTTTGKDGNSGSGSCTPVPDEYGISLTLNGNPKTVTITLSRDAVVILSDSRAPKYERQFPNGSDCDEGCTQGGYQLSFED